MLSFSTRLLILIFIGIGTELLCQYESVNLGRDNGLREVQYNAFVDKDSYGFWWVSSLSGAYRYNGLEFKHYEISPNNNIDENIQSHFFEDVNGDIWFTTFEGLHRYERSVDSIRNYQVSIDGEKMDTYYHLFSYEKSTNKLWLKAGNTIGNFNIINHNFEPQFLDNSTRFTVSTNYEGVVNRIFSFPWMEGNGFSIWEKSLNNSWNPTFSNRDQSSSSIRDGLVIKNDLWLATDKGLLEFELGKNIAGDLFKLPQSIDFSLHSVKQMSDSTLLISSKIDGLLEFNLNKKTFSAFGGNGDAPYTTHPKEISIGTDGTIWVTYPNYGLGVYSLKESITRNPVKDYLGNANVKAILEDSRNFKWILSEDKGIFVFDNNNNLVNAYKNIDGINNYNDAQLSLGSNNNLWLAVNGNSYQFDTHTQDWKRVHFEIKNAVSICELTRDLLAFNTTGGLVLIKDEVIVSDLHTKLGSGLSFERMIPLSETQFLIPQMDYDIMILHINGDSINYKEIKSLDAMTFDAQLCRNNEILLGTNKGLYSLSLLDNSTRKINLIPDLEIYSIEVLGDKIYCSTNQGLMIASKNEYNWSYKIITERNHYSYLNKSSSILLPNNELWFGGVKGISSFDAEVGIDSLSFICPIIQDIQINALSYKLLFGLNPELTKELSIRYRDNVKIEFSATGDLNIDQARIEYRIGGNSNWSEIPLGGAIQFLEMQPGNLTLDYRAIDTQHVPSIIKSLVIKTPEPFNQTIHFKLLLTFILFLVITAVYLIITKQREIKLKRKLKAQDNLLIERERIAKELHDDLGSELASMVYISEELSSVPESLNISVLSQRLQYLAKSALLNMKDIVWALDRSQDGIQDLVQRLSDMAHQNLNQYNIARNIKNLIPDEVLIEIGGEAKRNVVLIFKEWITNIAKHANATEVDIKFKYKDKTLFIVISDNGIGFNPTIASTGNGLNNIQYRAQAINAIIKIDSSIDLGSSIKISIPLELKF